MSPSITNDTAPVNQFGQSSDVTRQPIVRILKRPQTIRREENREIRPRMPMKSLQQREYEYAQARARILGADSDPNETKRNESIQLVHHQNSHLTSAANGIRISRR